VRGAAEQALLRDQAPKPALLALGQWCALLAGAMFLLFLVLAPFDLASYSIEGEPVSGSEFLRRAGFGFGLLGGIQLAIGVGLMRDRPWARPLMLYYWLAVLVTGVSVSGLQPAALVAYALSAAIPGAIAAWYLYGKANVVAYFEALRRPGNPTGL
jgi:hypothetical protein